MIQVGDILSVIVVDVQAYGLHVDADGIPGLILIPELSWQRVSHPSQIAKLDDLIQCQVNHVPPDAPEHSPRFTASIRALYPQLNPWRDPDVYAVGTSFCGVVVREMSYGLFIQHPRDVWALLHVDDMDAGDSHPHVGDAVQVVITECNVAGKKIRVKLREADA